MRTSDLIARIEGECPGFAMVDHALTSAAEMTYPAAMVTPSKEDADPDGTVGQGAHTQEITQTYSIFFILERNQATGKTDELDDLRDEVHAALLGWELDADHGPMNFVGAMLDRFHTGVVCWRADYSTETQMRFFR
jgi:hypothetical protein